MANSFGISSKALRDAITNFTPIPHRLEWTGNINGVDYFNDSKATNAQATITAINALQPKYQNICLIAGGIQKNTDYQPLFSLINSSITSVILIGKNATELAAGININTKFAKDLPAAVKLAQHSQADAVLFSPACASFDMFADFAHRGRVFKECVS